MAMTDEKDHSHVQEMDDGKRQQNASCHRGDAAEQFCPGMQCLPQSDHECGIAKVEQIITGKKDPVDKVSEFFVPLQ